MSNKTEETLRREVFSRCENAIHWVERYGYGRERAMTEANVVAAFDALRDHYQARPEQCCAKCGSLRLEAVDGSARPTFEGDEAEVRKEIADIAAMTYEGHWSHKALALLDAKDERLASAAKWNDLYANARDEALARAEKEAAYATELHEKLTEVYRQRDEEIVRAERAEQALADRDAAIVEACRRAQCSVACAPTGTSYREWWVEPLRPFLPAPEPVDPLVAKVMDQLWPVLGGSHTGDSMWGEVSAAVARGLENRP